MAVSSSSRSFDVAVVGAGLAGLAATLGFAKAGFDAVCIGRAERGGPGRTVALLGRTLEILDSLGVLAAVACGWALWRWLDWRADLWAVTSQRVIDESGVLSVRMIDSPLDKIHNITCEQSLWGRMLGYGTLNVQTAAEVGSTTIEKVTRPMELKEMILEQQQNGRCQVMARQVAPLVAAAATARTAAPAYGRPGAPASGTTQDDARECPYCAEIIKVRARVCRFCGRDV